MFRETTSHIFRLRMYTYILLCIYILFPDLQNKCLGVSDILNNRFLRFAFDSFLFVLFLHDVTRKICIKLLVISI